jgi:glycosyltransferase involved in cell wall biosynthesis
MRIAQFAESYRPVLNGAAVAVDTLSRELAHRGHEVEVFAPGFRGFRDDFTVRRFPSYCWPHHPEYPVAIPIAPGIARHFDRAGFAVVHAHSPFTLGQLARRWARRASVPLVTTYHTLYVEYAHYAAPFPPGPARAYLQALSRRYCNACDAVATPTEPIRKVLVEYGVTRPIHVIPTGLKLTSPPPPDPEFPRGELRIPPDALVVLYAGRLAREKNLKMLLSAFARVAAAIPKAWLLLAGDGPETASAMNAAGRTGAAERIVFAGGVPPQRMPLVYAAADVFAFASLHDTQGLVLTEAKAAGLPAVAVNAYGPSTVITHGVDGFLTSNDVEAFSAALLEVLGSTDLRKRLGENALREARRFSIEATAAAYERLYAEAAEIRRIG